MRICRRSRHNCPNTPDVAKQLFLNRPSKKQLNAALKPKNLYVIGKGVSEWQSHYGSWIFSIQLSVYSARGYLATVYISSGHYTADDKYVSIHVKYLNGGIDEIVIPSEQFTRNVLCVELANLLGGNQ